MAENKKEWYVLRAISGKEAKVKEVLDAAIKNTSLGEYVSQVLIPTEKVYTTRNGKKVLKERNLYSGYVFVEANLTGEVIYELETRLMSLIFCVGAARAASRNLCVKARLCECWARLMTCVLPRKTIRRNI